MGLTCLLKKGALPQKSFLAVGESGSLDFRLFVEFILSVFEGFRETLKTCY
jgi:hypothetical protein